jgi:fermentation-respiration switch protein FrsA (DUF1100 family)
MGVTAWNFLTNEKKIDSEDIIIWGRSLGGGVAAEIAQSKGIAALILESTFFSLSEVIRWKYWYLPTAWMLKFHFNNGRKLHNITAPIIIIHSTEDDYVPFSQAEKLYNAAPDPKFMIKTTGSHLDSFDARATIIGSPLDGDNQGRALSRLMNCLSFLRACQ